MGTKYKGIIQSSAPPTDRNWLWLNNGILRWWNNGWKECNIESELLDIRFEVLNQILYVYVPKGSMRSDYSFVFCREIRRHNKYTKTRFGILKPHPMNREPLTHSLVESKCNKYEDCYKVEGELGWNELVHREFEHNNELCNSEGIFIQNLSQGILKLAIVNNEDKVISTYCTMKIRQTSVLDGTAYYRLCKG